MKCFRFSSWNLRVSFRKAAGAAALILYKMRNSAIIPKCGKKRYFALPHSEDVKFMLYQS